LGNARRSGVSRDSSGAERFLLLQCMKMPLLLLADRFVCDVHGRAFDLATADEVRLIDRLLREEERAAWREECQQALELCRLDGDSMIEYVEIGPKRCVEVYAEIQQRALAGAGLGAGASAGVGASAAANAGANAGGIAIRLLPQAASAGACAAFEDERFDLLKCLHIRARRGAGLTTWLRLIAREARHRGLVPLCPRAIALWPAVLPLIRYRSIVLLCDRAVAKADDGQLARALLTLSRAKGRVCAIVCPTPPRLARPALRLWPHPARALAEAVKVPDGLTTARDAFETLAREVDGLPGRFVTQLLAYAASAPLAAATPDSVGLSTNSEANVPTNGARLRAAEAAVVYAIAPQPHETASDHADMLIADAWNLHGRYASVIRDADALITRGRWAAAMRTLRAGVAAHQRRGVPQAAAVAALALARLSLLRCEIAEAERWCREAGELAARAPDELLAADTLHWSGLIALENADLESSDRWLRMALIAAEQHGHVALQRHIEASLARCQFWQGAINQMSTACDRASQEEEEKEEEAAVPPLMRPRALRLAARRHLARGELSDAGAALVAAAEAIELLDDSDPARAFDHRLRDHEKRDWVSALHVDRARLQLAIGDRARCQWHLDAAAAGRPTPGRLARIRLVQIECDQQEQTDETRRRVARLTRVFLQPRMPRLLRLRARYLIEPESRRSAELARFIDRYGESALACRVTTHRAIGASQFRTLLQMSHDAGDERAVLTRICAFVREQLAAAYVAVHSIGVGGYPRLASAGQSRLASVSLSERVIDTGVFLSPRPADDAIEAGAPVHANDEMVGAIVSRWIIDRTIDRPLTTVLLPAAADAAAPHVRAILDRAGTFTSPATRWRPGVSDSDSGGGSTGRGPSASGSGSAGGSTGRRVTISRGGSAGGIGINIGVSSMLGVSPQIVRLREMIARAADAPFHVLIEGESGSGKELVARALHQQSVRRIRRFCAVNCAALTDDLLEAELFGHARGAFTGALAERIGLFEEAHEGTLFLDEVGELTPRAQAKLLRAIQDGEIRRIGENLPRRVQPRIVAATNRHLHNEAAAGRFRSDLLYRLDVVRIAVPPLRDRVEDVPVLARAFWEHALTRTGSRATLDPETLAALARYDWPGNVRELQNVIARMAVHAPARGRVDPQALPPPIRPAPPGSSADATDASPGAPPLPLDRARRAFEEQFVRAALARAGGHLARAARDLGVTRQGLTRLIARLGITIAEESSTIDMDTKAVLDAYVDSDTDPDAAADASAASGRNAAPDITARSRRSAVSSAPDTASGSDTTSTPDTEFGADVELDPDAEGDSDLDA
jgi:DNA-binding NtrC family response regulator